MYILTANHCRGTDSADDTASYASVVFGHHRPACSGDAHSAASVRRLLGASGAAGRPLLRELQGVQVAWQDEATDVLLLRLDIATPDGGWSASAQCGHSFGSLHQAVLQCACGTVSKLPAAPPPTHTHTPAMMHAAEFGAGRLGWNASGWAHSTTAVATLSHPHGDYTTLSRSSAGLRLARSSAMAAASGGGLGGDSGGGGQDGGATHYKVRWEQGGTDTGSSGAPLLHAARLEALGVLTGGSPDNCLNSDFFGSLRAVGGWMGGFSA